MGTANASTELLTDPIAMAAKEWRDLHRKFAAIAVLTGDDLAAYSEAVQDWRRRYIGDGPASSPVALWAWLHGIDFDIDERISRAHDGRASDATGPTLGERRRREAFHFAMQIAQADARLDVPDPSADLRGIAAWAVRAARRLADANADADADRIDDEAMLATAALGRMFDIANVDALRKRLERYRQTNHNGWTENEAAGPRDPKFLYRLGTVRQICKDAASSERPA